MASQRLSAWFGRDPLSSVEALRLAAAVSGWRGVLVGSPPPSRYNPSMAILMFRGGPHDGQNVHSESIECQRLLASSAELHGGKYVRDDDTYAWQIIHIRPASSDTTTN